MFKNYLYCSFDLDFITLIFDHDLEQMALAKYTKVKPVQTEQILKFFKIFLKYLLLWPWTWPMTLVLKLDPDFVMTYFHTKMRSIVSNIIS